jgi:methanogenic corrinoid protein MtbC1
MRDTLTPKQVALAIGASEASLKRWCDKGLVPSVRTLGGHRRLPLSGVVEFLRKSGQPLVRPELLGLPSTTGKGNPTIERARAGMREALEAGDEEQLARVTFDLYLAGHRAADICDRPLAEALHDLGTRWQHGEVEVYEERRGIEVCLRVLHRFRRMLPAIDPAAPLAIGATLEGDAYSVPTCMVELTLREGGWRAESYGTGHPPETIAAALETVRPRLLWLSVSTFPSREIFLASYARVQAKAEELGIALAVGGRALGEDLRREMKYSAFCDTLGHMTAFAAMLAPTTSPTTVTGTTATAATAATAAATPKVRVPSPRNAGKRPAADSPEAGSP